MINAISLQTNYSPSRVPTMSDIKVLLYEDNTMLREALSFMIGGTDGFELAGAFGDCLDANRQVSKLQPDVVLMDIDLPERDGITALTDIKRRYAHVDVLMLTVFDDDDRVFESLKAGATGYLLKKTPPARIMEAIQEVYNGGAPITPSIARRVLLHLHDTPVPASGLSKLTDREMQVLEFLAEGNSYKMVADLCGIGIETVRTHIKHIYEKLQVHSVTEAVAKFWKK
ncbi:response regulator [Persicitalea sp.]|uniref:response regulator transcription factor n=1 Tax=Persicitalea sp. TaxID=3100273 RepID=UPI0035932B27